jgi:hypothetical protein
LTVDREEKDLKKHPMRSAYIALDVREQQFPYESLFGYF